MSEATLRVDLRVPLDRFELRVALDTTHRITGVFGPSGSGKTTLLQAIAGLRRDAVGLATFGDRTWLDSGRRVFVPPEHRAVGYVPQDALLFPHLDVRGNLTFGRDRATRGGEPFAERLESVVRGLEIGPLLDRRVAALSGGERQRVALGRALCSGPRLLLLDEPLASLDVALRLRLLPFLRRIEQEFSLPILLVSHDPFEVQALCEDLIVLREGRVIARGRPSDVLTSPDVFPIAEVEGFENVLSGIVESSDGGSSVVMLGRASDAPRISIRGVGSPGDAVLLGLRADDVLLATEPPRGLSARNVLPAELDRVDAVGDVLLVRAMIHPDLPPLAVEISRSAWTELQSTLGRRGYVVFKSSAVRRGTPPGPLSSPNRSKTHDSG